MISCAFSLLTPVSIASKDFGRQLFNLIFKHFPDRVPVFYGDVEPLRNRFDPNQIDVALELWGKGAFFMTKRKEREVSMMVSFSGASRHGRHSKIVYFNFPLEGEQDLPSMRLLVIELSQTFLADFAMAHILTRHELDARLSQIGQQVFSWPTPPAEVIVARLRKRVDREGYERVLSDQDVLKVQTVQLRKHLPNLFWLNVFGVPYANLIGMDRLMSSPCESIEVLPYGGVSLLLTPGIADDAVGWGTYLEMRERCKHHLGANLFYDPSLPKDHTYQTPTFDFTSAHANH